MKEIEKEKKDIEESIDKKLSEKIRLINLTAQKFRENKERGINVQSFWLNFNC